MIPEAALLCLALNLYHEARGEPVEGQIAVSLVVLNRAKFNRTSICREVYRPFQFSWTIRPQNVKSKRVFNRLKLVALKTTTMFDFTDGATHYHSVSVAPKWAKSLQYVGRWGNHLFYKEKT